MKGKVVLITGATTGIGKETAMGLAGMGATLVIVGRSPERLDRTVREIETRTGNRQVDPMLCDLSSMAEVRKLAAGFKSKYDRLDVLVNNAGGIIAERKTTVDGYEYTFAFNHLSPFLLTNLLLDRLKASAPSRVVSLSSSAHQFGHIDFDDLMSEKRFGSMRAYSQAKLADLLFVRELARRLQGTGVTANAVHPGVVRSNFGIGMKGVWRVFNSLIRPFIMGTKRGAETSIYLASSPDVEGITGRYFAKKKEKRSSKEAQDDAVAKRLWEVSEELTGVG